MRPLVVDELAALADGTLAPERREALLEAVSAWPRLAWELELQMTAVKVLRDLDASAPPELRQWLEYAIPERGRPDDVRLVVPGQERPQTGVIHKPARARVTPRRGRAMNPIKVNTPTKEE